MESMDKLSLELLTNRRQYRKYLDKIDPKKFEETEELKVKRGKYASRILDEMKYYLYDNRGGDTLNHELEELLPIITRQFIRHFEEEDMKIATEKKNKKGWQMDGPDEEDAVDSLEEHEEEGDEDEEDEEDEDEEFSDNKVQEFMKSYWGKSCIKKT